ncbi:MAG: glycosyltransferase [Roseovarius sp.]|nr:glycosyltransferase [Roseovarius sp.]MBK45708.1 glycosyltransferase [Roseovarius sp.]
MPDPISVIVPARNEAATIGTVVATMRAMQDVAEVVVIDNASEDDTAARARAAGAVVVDEARRGMGHAVRRGVAAARHDWVMKIDADLDRFHTALFARMGAARAPGVGLVKGVWSDPKDNMPMTRLLVRPALRLMFPGLGGLEAPNTGIYLFDRARIAHAHLTGDYAVDIDVMLRVHAAGARVAEVDIGRIRHDARDIAHYNGMAEEILGFFLSRQPLGLLEDVMVIARTEAEAVCHAGALMAGKLIAGARVSVYLGEGGEGLDTVFADLPTYRWASLSAAASHVPHANASRLRVIAAPGLPPVRPASSVPVEVWEMADGTGKATDVLVGTGAGAALKRAALQSLGLPAEIAPQEMFRVVETPREPVTRP